MKLKFIIGLILVVIGFEEVNATPIFAEQYKMRCNACHSLAPTLNSTGLKFLRNGFRFSKDDKTWLEGFLDANSSEERLMPVHGLAGINIDSKSREEIEKLNIYLGGTMTDTVSVYAVTRSTYNMPVNNNLFGETSTRAFVQWNPKSDEHVVKVGWMDPITMFSNTDRTLMDNALMGSGLMKMAPASIKKPTYAVTPPKPPAPGADATPQQIQQYQMAIMPKQPYVLPVPYTGVGLVKGLEYSYLYNEKMMFLVNYGIPTSVTYATDDDSELTTGIEVRDVSGYTLGLIYIHKELGNITSDSYILPIEKHFFDDQLLFQTSFVYKDSDQYADPYYGSQTTLVYQLDENAQIRTILSLDQDEAKENNTGVSITYSRSWNDRYLVHITGARHKGAVFDESIAKFSFYIFL